MTYNLTEAGLEVVDTNVVLDGIQLCDQSNLCLHQGGKLLLNDLLLGCQLLEVLVDDDDVRLLDLLNNRQGLSLLGPRHAPQLALDRWRYVYC